MRELQLLTFTMFFIVCIINSRILTKEKTKNKWLAFCLSVLIFII